VRRLERDRDAELVAQRGGERLGREAAGEVGAGADLVGRGLQLGEVVLVGLEEVGDLVARRVAHGRQDAGLELGERDVELGPRVLV